MTEVQFLFESAFDMLYYIVPTITVLSAIFFADVIVGFIYKIFITAKKHVRI